jgi:ABC-type antimicrobial peptide transport system permease subunit
VRRIVTAVDPQQPLGRIRPLPDLVAASTARPRSSTQLLITLSTIALLLAAIGIYGVVAYAMTLRVPEIGMRMALGADRLAVASLVAREGVIPCVAGVVIGAAGAAGLSRVIASLLVGVSPLDPLAFSAGAIAMLVATALACAMPVVRALRLDPATALRAN